MKILKKYKELNSQWKNTTIKECIEHMEDNGYWKKDTVLDLLKNGMEVFTPFAIYKLKV